MKIAPLTDNVAVLIHEDTEVVFTPAFKPKTEVIKQQRQQIQEEYEYTIWDACWEHMCVDVCFKIKYFCCVFVFLIIVAVVIFFIACGRDMCPGTGMRGSSRRSPPPY
jgi:hypothetical protein